AFEEAISKSKDALIHRIDVEVKGINVARDTHLANRAAENVLGLIAAALARREHDTMRLRTRQFAVTIARKLLLDADETIFRLNQLVLERRTQIVSKVQADQPRISKLQELSPTETELLETLVLHPELAPTALTDVTDDDLTSATAREIFQTYR